MSRRVADVDGNRILHMFYLSTGSPQPLPPDLAMDLFKREHHIQVIHIYAVEILWLFYSGLRESVRLKYKWYTNTNSVRLLCVCIHMRRGWIPSVSLEKSGGSFKSLVKVGVMVGVSEGLGKKRKGA